jgi:acetoin utilization deacetylase AcuC-like enzyme
MNVGIVYDPVYLKHDTGIHLENSGRLESIISYLEQNKLMPRLAAVSPHPATENELCLIHDAKHVNYIKSLALSGGGYIDSDTVVSIGSYQSAIYAAGGAIQAAEAVIQSRLDSVFALVRPPGHHATPNRAMGFCLFNNIAIAAKYLLFKYSLERLAIIDFDVHHGNGTQEAFYANPQVLYVSTHQSPLYPGTGNLEEIGSGEALGTKVNIPLPPGCTDTEYEMVFEKVVVPAVRRFRPQIILVSAGYDSHWSDRIAAMQVTIKGFVQIVKTIKTLAEEMCEKRLVMVLEGGYNPDALAASVKATFEVLLGDNKVEDVFDSPPLIRPPLDIQPLVQRIKEIHDLI